VDGGSHEKAGGELKAGLPLASVRSLQYAANGAWHQLGVLTFNLGRGVQVAAGLALQQSRAAASLRFPQHPPVALPVALRAAPTRRHRPSS
jgi:hypothetical protein